MAKSPKKPAAKKKPRERLDLAQNALRVVMEATGQAPKTPDPDAEKDPKAISRGRKGGKVGGKARAAKLTKKQRTLIAKKAAAARWGAASTQ